ncbi:MAG TPA: RNA ligase family protein [Pirellulales bacterium]
MLYYPKIPGSKNAPRGRCWAFEKYDGTNLHFTWDREIGWHAFGTRRDEFDLGERGVKAFQTAHPHLAECVPLFFATTAEPLTKVIRDSPVYREVETIRVFTEFCGPNSFAGLHAAADPKQLVLFDVLLEPSGLVGPRRFVADFAECNAARVVYEGSLTGRFAEAVRGGEYRVAEGVVCKIGTGGDDLWMGKIKTYAYLERLKKAFAEKWEDYWE